jgi:hypothetical protein
VQKGAFGRDELLQDVHQFVRACVNT